MCQEVKISSAAFLLLRIPTLRIRSLGRKVVFEANLKGESELWNLMVKEMWGGRKMADEHKVRVCARVGCVCTCVCVWEGGREGCVSVCGRGGRCVCVSV